MRLMCFSNTTRGSYGYSIVMKNLARGFRVLGHEVVNVSAQDAGDVSLDEYGTPNIPVRSSPFYADCVDDYLVGFKPDAVLTLWDITVPDGLASVQAFRQRNVPWVYYATISGSPLSAPVLDRARVADVVVSPSKFGLEELRKCGVNALYIPHGVDPAKFFSEKQKQEDYKKEFGLEGKFVFLMVQRNRHPQKNMLQFFFAVQEMVLSEPGLANRFAVVVLTDIMDPPMGIYAGGVPLYNFKNFFGLGNCLFFVKQRLVKSGGTYKVVAVPESCVDGFYANANFRLDEAEMRKLYTMADCVVSSSLAESFSLPLLESQACGTPVIAPKHTTGFELVQEPETGLLCDTLEPQFSLDFSTVSMFSIPSMVGCMKKMVLDEEFRLSCSKRCLENSSKYSWERIVAGYWKPLLEGLQERSRALDYSKGQTGL